MDIGLSFPDPRAQPEKMFEIHLRSQLSKKISVCRGNCARPITDKSILLVKSQYKSTYFDPILGCDKTKMAPAYIHFNESCLKDFDADSIYGPSDSFAWEKLKLHAQSKTKMKQHDIQFLEGLGVQV